MLGNYNITYATANFTITKKAASVTPSAGTKGYGAVEPTLTGTLSGFLVADGVTATYSRTAGETVAGSPYAISAVLSPDGVLGNYNITYTTANFTIAKATVTATAGSGSTTYDGATHLPSACVVSGTYTGGATCTNTLASVGPAAGTTPITPDVSSIDASNFAVTSVAGSYTIAQASSTTVVTCPASVVYTGAAQTPCTASYSGAGGLSGALTPTYLNNLYPGTATANASYAGDANHTASSGSATFAIGYGACSAGFGPGGIILQPINSDGTSVYQRKGGSTIPVKFTVCGASGLPISDPSAVFAGTGGALTMLSAVRGTVTGINEVGEPVDIPDVAFRWAGDKWIFNMATSNLTANMNYTFRVNLRVGPITFKVGIK